MCDYSLQHLESRAAQQGDKLVAVGFKLTTTRGFAAESEPDVPVCLLPGTQLAFEKDVRVENHGFLGTWTPARRVHSRVATFIKINENEPYAHHDALQFPTGDIVLLSRLATGQKATVLQLPVQEEPGGGTGTITRDVSDQGDGGTEMKQSVVAPAAMLPKDGSEMKVSVATRASARELEPEHI